MPDPRATEPIAVPDKPRSARRLAVAVVLIVCWALLLALAFAYDTQTSDAIAGAAPKKSVLRALVTWPKVLFGVWGYAAIGVLLAFSWDRVRRVGAYLLTIGACIGTLHLLKFVFGRARPEVADIAGVFTWFGDPRLKLDSFPSGHSTQSFLLAALVGYYVPWTRWILFPLAALVAIGRVATERHYPSDITAGMGLALAFAWAAPRVLGTPPFRRFTRRDLEGPPAPAPAGITSATDDAPRIVH